MSKGGLRWSNADPAARLKWHQTNPSPEQLHQQTYQLEETLLCKTDGTDEIQCFFGVNVRFRVSRALFNVLLEFRSPATLADVHARLDSDLSFDAFVEVLEPLIALNVLWTRHDEASAKKHPSFEDVVNPSFLAAAKDKTFLDRFRSGGVVVLQNAFLPEVAEEVATSIESAEIPWARSESHLAYRQYAVHLTPLAMPPPPALRRYRTLMEHPRSKRFMSKLADAKCEGSASIGFALSRAGDYSDPHLDYPVERPGSISFIWYLTREWKPSWGGNLHWFPTGTVIVPSFNTLVIFSENQRSFHGVSPVLPDAQGVRRVVTGWYTGPSVNLGADESLRHSQWFTGPTLEPVHPEASVFVSRSGRK